MPFTRSREIALRATFDWGHTKKGLGDLSRSLRSIDDVQLQGLGRARPEVDALAGDIRTLTNEVSGLAARYRATGGEQQAFAADMGHLKRQALSLAAGLDTDSDAYVRLMRTASQAEDAIERSARAHDKATTSARGHTSALGMLTGPVKGIVAGYGAIEAAQTAVRWSDEAAAAGNATRALSAYTGGLAGAAVASRDVRAALDGGVSGFQATQIATQLAALGIATASDEMAEFARSAALLGAGRMGAQESIDNILGSMMTGTTDRLDQMGLSTANVRRRQEELLASTQGLSREQAFARAVMDEMSASADKLEAAGVDVATSTDRARSAWADLRVEAGKGIAPVIEGGAEGLLRLVQGVSEAHNKAWIASKGIQEAVEAANINPVQAQVLQTKAAAGDIEGLVVALRQYPGASAAFEAAVLREGQAFGWSLGQARAYAQGVEQGDLGYQSFITSAERATATLTAQQAAIAAATAQYIAFYDANTAAAASSGTHAAALSALQGLIAGTSGAHQQLLTDLYNEATGFDASAQAANNKAAVLDALANIIATTTGEQQANAEAAYRQAAATDVAAFSAMDLATSSYEVSDAAREAGLGVNYFESASYLAAMGADAATAAAWAFYDSLGAVISNAYAAEAAVNRVYAAMAQLDPRAGVMVAQTRLNNARQSGPELDILGVAPSPGAVLDHIADVTEAEAELKRAQDRLQSETNGLQRQAQAEISRIQRAATADERTARVNGSRTGRAGGAAIQSEHEKAAKAAAKAHERAMKDAQRAAERAAEEYKRTWTSAVSKVQNAWQTALGKISSAVGQGMDMSISVSDTDMLMAQAGMYTDKFNESGRRLADIVNRGAESPWVDFFPELMGLEGDTLKASAAKLQADIESYLRPDLLNPEAALESARRSLIGNRNREEMNRQLTQQLLAEGFGESEIRAALEGPVASMQDVLGPEMVTGLVAGTREAMLAEQAALEELGELAMGSIGAGARRKVVSAFSESVKSAVSSGEFKAGLATSFEAGLVEAGGTGGHKLTLSVLTSLKASIIAEAATLKALGKQAAGYFVEGIIEGGGMTTLIDAAIEGTLLAIGQGAQQVAA